MTVGLAMKAREGALQILFSAQVKVTQGIDEVILVRDSKKQTKFIKWHDRLTDKDNFFYAILVPHGVMATIKNTGDGGFLNWGYRGQLERLPQIIGTRSPSLEQLR